MQSFMTVTKLKKISATLAHERNGYSCMSNFRPKAKSAYHYHECYLILLLIANNLEVPRWHLGLQMWSGSE